MPSMLGCTAALLTLLMVVALSGSARASNDPASDLDPASMLGLHADVVIAQITARLNLADSLNLTATSSDYRQLLVAYFDYRFRCALYASYRPDPRLRFLITSFASRVQSGRDIAPPSDSELALVHDRIRALRLPKIQTDKLLAACHVLSPNAAERFAQLHASREDPWARDVDDYRVPMSDAVLAALRELGVDGLSGGEESERAVVAAFVAAGLGHKLYDRETLVALLTNGVRLHLVVVLFYVDVPIDALNDLLPLFQAFWTPPRLARHHLNHRFLRSLALLGRPGSRTPLAAFWALPAVREFYQSRLQGLVNDLCQDLEMGPRFAEDYPPKLAQDLQAAAFPFFHGAQPASLAFFPEEVQNLLRQHQLL